MQEPLRYQKPSGWGELFPPVPLVLKYSPKFLAMGIPIEWPRSVLYLACLYNKGEMGGSGLENFPPSESRAWKD